MLGTFLKRVQMKPQRQVLPNKNLPLHQPFSRTASLPMSRPGSSRPRHSTTSTRTPLGQLCYFSCQLCGTQRSSDCTQRHCRYPARRLWALPDGLSLRAPQKARPPPSLLLIALTVTYFYLPEDKPVTSPRKSQTMAAF